MSQSHTLMALLLLLATEIHGQFAPSSMPSATKSSVAQHYGRLPLVFEPNRGQADKDVLFLAASTEQRIELKRSSAVVKFADGFQIEMETVGGRTPRLVQGLDQTEGLSSYFIGNAPSKWHTGIPNYRRVEYLDIYPGVNLIFYGQRSHLEYDIVLAAGVDPGQVQLNFQGATSIETTKGGDLLIRSKGGTVLQRKADAYQIIGGRKVQVEAAYRRTGSGGVRLSLSGYDRHEPVVVDPILVYSTYVGEIKPVPSPLDEAEAIAVDGDGNAYLAGTHWQENGSSNAVAFVSKLSPDGSTILYTAHVGGSNTDQCYAVAVDSNQNAYITGYTTSIDFPTVNPFQRSLEGSEDAFIAKLSSDGTSLVYSTYLGDGASGSGIAVNANGNAYVTGGTGSSDFPLLMPFQSTYGGGGDAFVTKMSTDGASLVFSTYLGGSGAEVPGHIAIDADQNVYVIGSTTSTDFPVALAYQATLRGSQNVYVTEFAADGQTLVYSTYLGGSGTDTGTGIAVDSLGAAYITGATKSSNFPTKNPLQSALMFEDAFVTKISPGGSQLSYSTYLGGTALDQGNDVAVDSSGNAYVVGRTYSDNFPMAYPLQGTNAGYSSGFASKISADGGTLDYSTYLGSTGDGNDEALGIAVDSSGAAYVGGYTSGTNFPTTSGSAQSPGFPTAGFVTKIADSPSPCDYSGVPATLDLGSNATIGSLSVITGSQCSWIASTNQFWFSITSADTGTGSGTVTYSVAQNVDPIARSAVVSIGPQIINVTQGTEPCVYSMSSTGQSFTALGGSGTVNFSASITCSGWSVSNANSWFSVDPTLGAGNATFTYTVDPNPISSARTGVFTVGPEQFTITEAAGSPEYADTTTSVTATSSVISASASTVLTATVAANFGTTSPTGMVSFTLGQTVLGASSLFGSGGTATASLFVSGSQLSSGINIVTATYGGNTGFVTSSASIPITVGPGLGFYALTPCRIADTRTGDGFTGAFGPPSLVGGATRNFPIQSSSCDVPATAQAYSLNITAVPRGPLGYLTAWPAGWGVPIAATLNSPGGSVIANAAIVLAGTNGAISLYASSETDVVIDINGYFAPPGAPQALEFYPLMPCRVADTRPGSGFNGMFGSPALVAGATRDFPVQQSTCGIPATAQAYSVRMTVVATGPMGYLTTWPAGQSLPIAATLNAPNGGVVGNEAIVPAGTNGDIDVYASANTNLVIDINGYFAPPGSTGALNFYPLVPCRIADTRTGDGFSGAFGPPSLVAEATRSFPIPSSSCGIPNSAAAYSLNLTAIASNPLGYLTAWQAGQILPVAATLNDVNGGVVGSAAIVPAGTSGAIDVYSSAATNLVIDINGYFGP